MLQYLTLMALLTTHNAWARPYTTNVETQNAAAQNELQKIDDHYSFIRISGHERFERFIDLYVSPQIAPGKYRETALAEYFGILNYTNSGPEITFEEAVKISALIFNFSRPENFAVLKINESQKEESLFRSFAFYSIGLIRALDNLEKRDLKHQVEINVLKKQIVKTMSQFLTQFQPRMLTDKWEIIYLYLFQSFYSDFDAEVVGDLAQKTAAIIREEKSESFEVRAANNLLLEISLICMAKCTLPGFKIDTDVVYHLNHYIKSVANLCHLNCISGLGRNPESSGFYTQYLGFLKSTNDPDYDRIKSDVVWKYFRNYMNGSLFSFKEMIKEQPYQYLKQGLGGVGQASILLFAFIFHYAPAYYVLFFIALFLLTLTGNERLRNEKIYWAPILPINKLIFSCLFKNFYSLISWTIKTAKNSIFTFSRNTWKSFGNDSEPIYKIASSILLVAITLLLSNLYSNIDRML